MRKFLNNANSQKFAISLLYIYSYEETCVELCEVFRDASVA
jgi:hypothetical protein